MNSVHIKRIHLFLLSLIFSCSNIPIDQKQTTTNDNWDTVSAAFYLKDSIHHGEATFYGIAGEGGNCMLPSPSPWDIQAGAMNHTDYRNGEVCGACVMVHGPDDSILIRINDQCPECKAGDIDLTPEAFERIGPKSAGRLAISWHFVPCPIQGNVLLHFTSGSSHYWTGIQVRNHSNPIRKMEAFVDSIGWTNITRMPYNRFEAKSLPKPPLTLRISDVFGAEIIDSAVPLLNDTDYELSKQFPEP